MTFASSQLKGMGNQQVQSMYQSNPSVTQTGFNQSQYSTNPLEERNGRGDLIARARALEE